MKIETLKSRILKSEEKIAKINGTLERHKNQLEKISKVLIEEGIDVNNYSNYNKYDYRLTKVCEDMWKYERKKEDVESNEKKLSEAMFVLNKLKQQLEDQTAKENKADETIPEEINIFLDNWKKRCVEYYTRLANEYIALKEKKYDEYELTRESLALIEKREYDKKTFSYIWVKKFNDEEIEKILVMTLDKYQIEELQEGLYDYHIRKFEKSHFMSDINMLKNIINEDLQIDNDKLNKILDNDVKEKKIIFIERIKEVIGEIKGFENLSIVLGELNGVAIGTKCNAKVETISAGGYNIQCFHYRVLVNAIKK